MDEVHVSEAALRALDSTRQSRAVQPDRTTGRSASAVGDPPPTLPLKAGSPRKEEAAVEAKEEAPPPETRAPLPEMLEEFAPAQAADPG